MGLIFEILVEFIVQVVFELLVELFGRALGRILETTLAVLAAVLASKARSGPEAETRFASLPTSLRPTAERLGLLSFLNVTLAIGVAAGYNA